MHNDPSEASLRATKEIRPAFLSQNCGEEKIDE